MDLKEQIVDDINSNSIILYMKGTKEMPQCGFSNNVVQILNHYGVEYKDINVLTDPNIRIKLSALNFIRMFGSVKTFISLYSTP